MGLICWFYVVFTIFWMLAVMATKRQGNTASETLAAGREQLWVTAPQKQSWLLLHKSKRITSGGTGQLTASQMSSCPSNIFSSNRVSIKLTELGCMQSCSMHCIKKKEPNDFANVFHLSPFSSFRKLSSWVSGWSIACLHMVRLEWVAAGKHPAPLWPS